MSEKPSALRRFLQADNRYRIEVRQFGQVVKRYYTRDFQKAARIWQKVHGVTDPMTDPPPFWVSVYINGRYQTYAKMHRLIRVAALYRLGGQS